MPPGPEPPRRKWAARAGTAVAWYLAIMLLTLPMAIAYVRKSGDASDAYAVGYAFGTGFLTLFVAAAAQALHARFTYRVDALPLPLFLGAAALLAIGAQYALRAADSDGGQVATAMAECREKDAESFDGAPSDLAFLPLDAQQQARILATAGQLPPGLSPDDLELRRIVANGADVGFAGAFPGVGESDEAMSGFGQGVMRDVVAGGGTVSTATMGREEGLVGGVDGFGAAVGRHGCWGIAVFGRDESSALHLGQSVFAR